MRIKNVTIGIRGVKDGLDEFKKVAKAIQSGKAPKKKKDGTYFVSLEAMRRILTPKRLELLHHIRERHPRSVYALAHLCDRALKNVQDDVSLLARIGLVSLSRSRAGRSRLVPRVQYDTLQLQIPVV